MDLLLESLPSRLHPQPRNIKASSKAIFHLGLLCYFLSAGAPLLKANVPGGIIPGSPAVTISENGNNCTMSNGIVSIVCDESSATIVQINYTYNNGNGTQTTNLVGSAGDGETGQLYWEFGNFTGVSGGPGNASFSVVANSGTYGEIDLLTTSSTAGAVDVHFSMLQGSPGFYVSAIWTHRDQDAVQAIGETRTNIYNSTIFNWMTVDSARNRLEEVPNGNAISVPGAPQECSIWTSGIYQGTYEDKYKNSAIFDQNRVWGWSSVGSGHNNIGMWNVSASMEYYNGGPLKRELMTQQIPDLLNMFNGGHYSSELDTIFAAGEVWNKTYGPYFVYCNSAPYGENEVTASAAMYNDALAQQAAEATAWPYSWFNNANYAPASQRGTVTGKIVISDTGNPNASAANLIVNLVQQPPTSNGSYDFQEWLKPYQFWTHTDANGNFTIPNVIASSLISGSNYTLYAFGNGAEGTFMSQTQSGGNPDLLYNLPSPQFSVPVVGGSTTALGAITWTPTRVGSTVFEIGYPDRTARKFRHGEDWWVGGIGPSPTSPDPIWSKYLNYPFDFPNGMTYTVGTSRWTTDWDFVQPDVISTSGNWSSSTGTINFTTPSVTTGVNASLYIGLTSEYQTPVVVKLNGTNLGTASGATSTPNGNSTNGYNPPYSDDTSIREGINSMFSDERITFPASLLKSGTNINTITINENAGSNAEGHIMYDYIRLELPGYVPPPPASVQAFDGNSSVLVSWPLTPGALTYNISRSNTQNTGFSTIATGVTGPVLGSGPNNGTWLDTTATNGDTYYYEVQSADTVSASVSSTQSAAVTPSAADFTTPPAAPTNFTATPGNRQVSLGWTAPAGASYYVVQRSTLYANTNLTGASATYNTLRTITLTNTVTSLSYIDTSVNNGTTYTYSVLPVNASGTGTAVALASPVIPVAPSPATAPTVTASPGDQQITLSWAGITNAVGYVIEEATSSGGPYTYVGSVTETTYTVTGLSNGTTYYFLVQAENSGGASANSNTATTTTAPPPPGTVIATPGNTQIGLSWSTVTSATGYTIKRGTVTGGPYNTTVATVAGPSYTNTGLTNGTPYFYVIETRNAFGTGSNSVEATATPTGSVPLAPTGLSATAGSAKVTLGWNASTGASSYEVGEATNNGGPYSIINASVSGTSFVDAGLQGGNTYYYVVAATGTGGTSPYSSQASATPTAGSGLQWNGNVSGTWDTTTANWLQGGSAITYTDGATVIFSDTAATTSVVVSGSFNPGSVSFNNSVLNYTLTQANGGVIGGATGLTMTGSANVTLDGPNTFTGNTVIDSGTLILGNAQALQDSTLNYNNQGGALSFGNLNAATLGGIIGVGTLPLANTLGNPVTLTIGNTTTSQNFGGDLAGTGSLNIPTGVVTLSGTNIYTGATTLTTGTLNISATGAIGSGGALAGPITIGSTANSVETILNVNGGMISATALTMDNQSGGGGGTPTEILLGGGGTITLTGALAVCSNNGNNNGLLDITSGTLNANSVTIGRDTNLGGTAFTSAISAGTVTGIYINGGALNITNTLQFNNGAGTNSSSNMRMDSGSVTVGGITYLASNAAGRYNVLNINGGAFTDNDSSGIGIQIGGVFANSTQDSELLILSGTLNTPAITLGDTNQTGGNDLFYALGGVTYIGAGGIASGNPSGATLAVDLGGGSAPATIGASSSWISSRPMSLTNSTGSVPVTFQTADINGNPFNITLSAALSGGGGLIKTGGGILTLAGVDNYSGATTVSDGVLEVTGNISNTNSVTIASGATFYLAGGSLSVGGNITNNGLFKISGTPTLAPSGSFINNGVLDLINGPSSLPPNFVNNGSVLNAGSVTVQQAAISGNTFSLSIQSYLQHNYQLQRAASLINPSWTNVGSSQAGTGSALNFADPTATDKQGFYRVLVSP
jgi:rhamnogalacturonan endolyase